MSQFPISSYPLVKYFFSVTHASDTVFNSSQLQWTHFPHRDNLYFVIDTPISSGPVKNIYLKVVWGTQVLEYIDFSTLCRQTLPAANPQDPPQPAILSVARIPCLAIRYPAQDGLSIRRFQIYFSSESIFDAARHSLESFNFPIQAAVKQTVQAPQVHTQLPTPVQFASQFQGASTNVYHPGGPAISNFPQPVSHIPQIPQISHTNPHGTLQMAPPTALPAPIGYPPCSLHAPALTTGTIPYNPSPLPPPRQLPNFTCSLPTESGGNEDEPRKKVVLIEDLPPLRKPTPATKPKQVPRTKAPVKTKGKPTSTPGSSSGSFLASKISRPGTGPASASTTATIYNQQTTKSTSSSSRLPYSTISDDEPEKRPRKQLKLTTSEFCSSPSSIQFKSTESASTPDEGSKRVRFQITASPEPEPIMGKLILEHVKNTATNGKEKSINVVNDGCLHTSESMVNIKNVGSIHDIEARERALEQERFRALENLIVSKIHDEEFCKLLCDVGRVWQRMGFENVFKDGNLFNIGDRH